MLGESWREEVFIAFEVKAHKNGVPAFPMKLNSTPNSVYENRSREYFPIFLILMLRRQARLAWQTFDKIFCGFFVLLNHLLVFFECGFIRAYELFTMCLHGLRIARIFGIE